jgi:acetolactate synthase I/II/III large subunit
VPIVDIVRQHATYRLAHDTPLTSDIEAIARPYSKWLRTSRAASELGRETADAIVVAGMKSGQIATLVVPSDAAWNE